MSQAKKRIGWIGTGVMGLPMASHVLDAGHSITVFTRTRQLAEAFEEVAQAKVT